MPIEKPQPLHSERMSESESHEEANMLRTYLGVSPETGEMTKPPLREVEGAESEEEQVDFVGREPTAEDYDKALEALAQLERDRRYESSAYMQGVIRVYQLVRSFGLGGLYAGRALTAAMNTIMPKQFRTSFKESWKEGKKLTDSEWETVFNDAEHRLQRLKVAADEFGKKETGEDG